MTCLTLVIRAIPVRVRYYVCARCRPLSSARPYSHWNWPYIFRESRCEKHFQNSCD